MKSNKNGVKLLAAVMVFAMAFAGVAVQAEDASAEGTALPTMTPVGTEVTATGNYCADRNMTITINVPGSDAESPEGQTTPTGVNLYVLSGVTVTIRAGANNSADVTVYSYTDDGTTKTPVENSEVPFGAMTADNGTCVYNAGEKPTFSGKIENDATIGSAVTKGIKVSLGTETLSTYLVAGTNTTQNLTEGQSVVVYNGSAIVSQGTNVIRLSNVVSGDGITVTGTASGGYPTVEGTYTAGTISINGGLFKEKEGSDLTATAPAVLNAVMETVGSDNYYMNQISSTEAIAADLTATAFKINGEIVQRISVNIADTAEINVGNGANYIIQSGVTVTLAGTVTVTGDVRVFGKLNVPEQTAEANIYIGATGELIGPDNAGKNTNVNSGDDYEISGVPSSKDVGDAVLKADLIIPEGMTFTINGNLGLNGCNLIVNGTVVVSKNASIYGTGDVSKGIVLGPKGVINGEGSVGALMSVIVMNKEQDADQKVTISGVKGAEFSYKTVDGVSTLAVTGNITKIRNASTGSIELDGSVIFGEMTVAKGVTLVGKESYIIAKSTVTIDGVLSADGTNAVKLGEGATIIINGTLSDGKAILAEVGTYDDYTNEFTSGNDAAFTATSASPTAPAVGNTPSGFTIYTQRIGITNDDGDITYVRYAYINGAVSAVVDGNESSPAEKLNISGNDVYIAEGESLNVTKNAKVTTGTGGVIIVKGSMTFAADSTALGIDTLDYSGASWEVTESTTSGTATYFAPLPVAILSIDSADEKTITAFIDDIDYNITVKADQILALTMSADSKILDDATVEVEDDGTITGTIPEVLGKLIVHPEATCDAPTSYASKKTGSDGTVTYAGFAVAVGEAQPGDVIDIDVAQVGTEEKSKDLNIPAGVKVVIADRLTVYGDLNIPAEAELVGGLIFVNGTESDVAAVNVEGTLDVSAGSLSGSYNEVFSTGKAIFATKYDKMNGAYVTVDGNVVLTSVSNALALASENSVSQINVVGKVTENATLTLNKNMVIDAGSTVVLGDVTLDSAKITANGTLSATVTAKNGVDDSTGAVTDSTLKVVKSTGLTLESKKVTGASGAVTYTYTFNAISGEMTVQAGTVTVNSALAVANNSRFTVAQGANLAVVDETTTINGDSVQFVVDGTLTVSDDGKVIFEAVSATGKVPVVNGTIDITEEPWRSGPCPSQDQSLSPTPMI